MAERNILVVAHTGREASLRTAVEVISRLDERGVRPVILPSDRADLLAWYAAQPSNADDDRLADA